MTENEARGQRQQLRQLMARDGTSSVGGGVARHITEECERLFCERLRAAFLGERKPTTSQDSLVVDVHNGQQKAPGAGDGVAADSAGFDARLGANRIVAFLEMYDYRGDTRYRGFLTQGKNGERSMFVFFEPEVVGKDLKPGLMALLELAYERAFDCTEMVVCLNRGMGEQDMASTTRDLGWVGFELTTLEPWTREVDDTSKQWFLLAMET